jgi:hypothetical protein
LIELLVVISIVGLFADGHVSDLKTTMNYRTVQALATRAGGEVTSGDY